MDQFTVDTHLANFCSIPSVWIDQRDLLYVIFREHYVVPYAV